LLKKKKNQTNQTKDHSLGGDETGTERVLYINYIVEI